MCTVYAPEVRETILPKDNIAPIVRFERGLDEGSFANLPQHTFQQLQLILTKLLRIRL